ncbi:hypothetical protein QCM77_43105 [Bradyrhizobium sp. SSUT18]|uniref:hypothetical protein n=1 Tax=Bradyrhizobium sp. SSUT18 TaxID=3040602 RepID=UPI0024485932|nr:hypothetical protein [Bradyrhizobium sp. SSUT18]MDH2406597.1 hypothetical protein [Bradyrhizobium sp. SSUT18]
MKLFGSALEQWSEEGELLGSETVGRILEPRTRQIANSSARYDHASDFLYALLRDHGQKVQCRIPASITHTMLTDAKFDLPPPP